MATLEEIILEKSPVGLNIKNVPDLIKNGLESDENFAKFSKLLENDNTEAIKYVEDVIKSRKNNQPLAKPHKELQDFIKELEAPNLNDSTFSISDASEAKLIHVGKKSTKKNIIKGQTFDDLKPGDSFSVSSKEELDPNNLDKQVGKKLDSTTSISFDDGEDKSISSSSGKNTSKVVNSSVSSKLISSDSSESTKIVQQASEAFKENKKLGNKGILSRIKSAFQGKNKGQGPGL